jgi:solute carrier family 8 (sodium/calcium exchanger)
MNECKYVNKVCFPTDLLFNLGLFLNQVGKINRTAVTITNDDEFNSVMNKMMVMTSMNVDGMRVHNETWAQQLKDAMNVNGGRVDDASAGDYVMHFLTFGFKIVFAFIPPAGIAGGWPAFICSLVMIAVITAIIGDLATIFGCLVGLKDSVTAITFVALGTSLPDTFASKAAAVGEKYADNAIGNITGSNSVNVFLGLGLPWLMAAIYHEANVSAVILYGKLQIY